jgi:transcriptional regulator with XRE-family HTH domain
MVSKEFNFKRGDKAKIAKACGMSTAALSQALSMTTSLEKGTKIQEAAALLGYDLRVKVKKIVVTIDCEGGK